jgi:sugar lactone lactonase YvrE
LVFVVLIIAGSYVYSRRAEPERSSCALPQAPGQLGVICGVQNPEDLEYSSALNLLLTAELKPGGRLMGLRLDDLASGPVALWPNQIADGGSTGDNEVGDPACTQPPKPESFMPHGLSVSSNRTDGAVRVAVVAHRRERGDRIELFHLSETPALHAVWRGCVELPPNTRGNDVALLPDGSLVATNFAPEIFGIMGWRYQMRGLIGVTTGDVMHWSLQKGWTHLVGTAGAIPNGIVANAEGNTYYFADGGGQRVGRITPQQAGTAPLVVRTRVDGPPDNVTLTTRGTILATIATFSGDLPVFCSLGGRVCRLGWRVVELDPETHDSARVLEQDASVVATATSALEIGDRIFIGTMADDRIGVYARPSVAGSAPNSR